MRRSFSISEPERAVPKRIPNFSLKCIKGSIRIGLGFIFSPIDEQLAPSKLCARPLAPSKQRIVSEPYDKQAQALVFQKDVA